MIDHSLRLRVTVHRIASPNERDVPKGGVASGKVLKLGVVDRFVLVRCPVDEGHRTDERMPNELEDAIRELMTSAELPSETASGERSAWEQAPQDAGGSAQRP